MHREEPPDDADQGHALAGAGSVRDLSVELGRLLELAVAVIPSTIGVSLVLRSDAPVMTVSAVRHERQDEPVLASLAVHLPRPSTWPVPGGRAELVIYAGTARAFRDAVPPLLALLDVSSRSVEEDCHLEVPDLAAEQVALAQWLDEQTLMDRAIGILLGRGLLPAEGRHELARRAAAAGTSTVEAALSLIAVTEAGRDQE